MRQGQRLDGGLDVARHVGGGLQIAAGQQHHELLAAEARHQVALAPAAGLRQGAGQRLQAGVAGQVAVVVVEVLEHVHVDHQQRQRRAGPLGARPFAGQRLVEVAAVGDAGEAVGVAQQLQLVVELRERVGALLHQRLQLAVALAQLPHRKYLVVARLAVGHGDADVGDLPCTAFAPEQHHLARRLAREQRIGRIGQVNVEESGGGQQAVAQRLREEVHHLDADAPGHLGKVLQRHLHPLGTGLDQLVAAAREAAEVLAEPVDEPRVPGSVELDVFIKQLAYPSLVFG